MKYLVIFLVFIGFADTLFALEPESEDYFSNPDFKIYNINEQKHTFFIPYSITNSKINDITIDCPSRAIVIDIEPAKESGALVFVLPRALLDSKYGTNDDSFFVLTDGQEVEFSEIEKNTEARVLKIPFSEGSSQIEIIVTIWISQSDDPLKFAPCGKADSRESPFYRILSPLKQFKSGVSFDEIQCKENLVLMQNRNSSPACVKPESRDKLILREWTIHSTTKTTFDNYRINCNNQTNPYHEYQCFKEAFSKCLHAVVNPEIYTIEGDPIYVDLRITSDCKISGIADMSTDRFWSPPETITTVCHMIESDEYSWMVEKCDVERLPEMQFNFMMQLYPKMLECEQNGNTWDNETLECVVNQTN